VIYKLCDSNYFTNLKVKRSDNKDIFIDNDLYRIIEREDLIFKKDGIFINVKGHNNLDNSEIKIPQKLLKKFDISKIPSKEIFYIVDAKTYKDKSYLQNDVRYSISVE
jgi:hypothetical protein